MMMVLDARMIRSGVIDQSVVVAGSGPLVILMHGWPELGLSYRHQIEPLARAGYTVAVPDMRGYGGTSKPSDVMAYNLDAMADDMAAIAEHLGARRWVSVGHDWGSPVAWRTALRFPDRVAGVFSLSVPHREAPNFTAAEGFELGYPDRFYYMRYFQEIGVAEAELERDPREALKRVYFALSGDAPLNEWIKHRPKDSRFLTGLMEPPPGPLSFMTDLELDAYAEQFRKGGFFGPLSWYRNLDVNNAQARAYGNQHIHQPVGFLSGDKEVVLVMMPDGIEHQRELCTDIRSETILPGAGHWIQQERPAEVTAALIGFLDGIKATI
jgi:pimeloyl-ACP methyl ester carboxylesterase